MQKITWPLEALQILVDILLYSHIFYTKMQKYNMAAGGSVQILVDVLLLMLYDYTKKYGGRRLCANIGRHFALCLYFYTKLHKITLQPEALCKL